MVNGEDIGNDDSVVEAAVIDGMLSALTTTITMAGMPHLANSLSDSKNENSNRVWAEKLWRLQQPLFQKMRFGSMGSMGGVDGVDSASTSLDLMACEGDSLNQLKDYMEMYGITHVTAPALMEIVKHAAVGGGEQTMEVDGAKPDYLDAYCQPSPDQLSLTDDFLCWQMRFVDMPGAFGS